jgi:ketosteroid isomerase-like protein
VADTKRVIEQAYSAFNERDIDGALALMTQDVTWPKASEGGKILGKEAVPIGLDDGASSIPMSNRLQQRRKMEAGPA